LLTGIEILSDWKETLRLRIVEGHNTSGSLLPIFLDDNCCSADVSDTGVDCLEVDVGVDVLFLSAVSDTGVDDLEVYVGVEGLLLSADTALLEANWDEGLTVLVRFGDGYRLEFEFEVVERVGDLYLELTSLIRGLRVVIPLFLSAGANGCLTVSTADSFFNSCKASNTSIHTTQIRRHLSTFYQRLTTGNILAGFISPTLYSQRHQQKKTQYLKKKILFRGVKSAMNSETQKK